MTARIFQWLVALWLAWLCVAWSDTAHAQDLDDMFDEDDDSALDEGDAGDGDDGAEEDAEPEPEGEAREDGEEEGEDEEDAEAASGPAEDSLFGDSAGTDDDSGLQVRFAAGLGVGTFGFRRPVSLESEVLPDSLFASVEGELAIGGWLGAGFSLESRLEYRTSVGMDVTLSPLFGLPERIDARLQGGALSLAPEVHLGAVELAFPVGFAATVWTLDVKQYPVEGFAHGGPFVRIEAALAVTRGLSLRLAPEGQWMLLQAGALADESLDSGLVVGGVGALELAVDGGPTLALVYQERRGFAVGQGGELRTVERLLSARVVGGF